MAWSDFEGEIPRSLIVDLAVGYGGSSSRVLNLLERFPEGTLALAGLDGGALPERAIDLGLPTYTVGPNKADPRIVSRLASIIEENGFQVVDTQNIQSKFWGSRAAAQTGAALVSTLNSWYADEHGGSVKGRAYTALERATNANLDLYITVSTKDTERVRAWGVPDDAIALIINAVELDVDSIPEDRDWLLNQFDLPEGAIVGAAAGRLVWQKGYPDLVHAMARIHDEHPEIHALVMGDGNMREEIEEMIAEHGLGNNIHLLGYRLRDEVLQIVKSSDLFIMPSRYEGTPVALLEAAVLGKPIVTTEAGGIPDLVDHRAHALVSPIEDPETYAEYLVEVATDPDYAAKLGAAAQAHVVEKFSPQAQAEQTARAYQRAWARRMERMGARA